MASQKAIKEQMQLPSRRGLSFIQKKRDHLAVGYVREIVDAINSKHEQDDGLVVPKEIKTLIATFIPNLWMDSTILTAEEKVHLLDMIANHQSTQKFANCEWKLIFRATRDGFSTAQFHEECDYKENTVCFVETEYDRVCGGFVELAWKNGNDGQWANKCPKAFMFTLRPNLKVIEQKKNSNSSVAHYLGDAFNFGYNDLYLKDNKTGYCQTNGHYDFNDVHEVAGAGSFKYNDYEVFQLVLNGINDIDE